MESFMPASKSLLRALSVGALTGALTLGALPSAFADPGDPSARSEEDRSARGLYVEGLEGGLPGLVESGSDDTASRRHTLVEAARTSGLTDEAYDADAEGARGLDLLDDGEVSGSAASAGSADGGGQMTELADEISRQADLRKERAERLAAERAEQERIEAEERAAREAAERKAAEEKAARERAERERREATVQTALDTALDQVGVPYRWGGTTPRGFDCSGFTSYAWRAAGVELPRTSRAQYGATRRVAADDLQPGDLLFFYSPVSHVGIYLGDGKMVDAPSSGRSVQVRSIYWSNFVGAGRPSY